MKYCLMDGSKITTKEILSNIKNFDFSKISWHDTYNRLFLFSPIRSMEEVIVLGQKKLANQIAKYCDYDLTKVNPSFINYDLLKAVTQEWSKNPQKIKNYKEQFACIPCYVLDVKTLALFNSHPYSGKLELLFKPQYIHGAVAEKIANSGLGSTPLSDGVLRCLPMKSFRLDDRQGKFVKWFTNITRKQFDDLEDNEKYEFVARNDVNAACYDYGFSKGRYYVSYLHKYVKDDVFLNKEKLQPYIDAILKEVNSKDAYKHSYKKILGAITEVIGERKQEAEFKQEQARIKAEQERIKQEQARAQAEKMKIEAQLQKEKMEKEEQMLNKQVATAGYIFASNVNKLYKEKYDNAEEIVK